MRTQLPSQETTWLGISRFVQSFTAWKAENTQLTLDGEEAEIRAYLDAQIELEGDGLVGRPNTHPILTLLEDIEFRAPRLAELMFARSAILYGNDYCPARKFIEGVRLTSELDEEYVQKTRCYGEPPAEVVDMLGESPV
ncbi:hypothetical protein HNP46_004169 [Pseudomonas nitritireducens]|uniref:Uncharacterized protein n=1 Tax=Pseudomonas nitroreducens TaxID=46680 RepID=A0A7W7KN08_PSENT|nr:hypothetical protein [Pseudomonas nitritireducens]MBB4865288.1 hypothetical protein [Pseudomonas nitritireducens]